MNQTQPYMDMHSSHMSSAQPYASQSATAGGLSHYPQYQQPPVLQPGSTSYTPSPSSFGHYGYANGVTSPQSGSHPASTSMGSHVPAQLLPLPAMATAPAVPHGYVAGPGGSGQPYAQHSFDTTGQVAPPGMKPRVTATLWEDEGSLCFQVEAKGVCVARREDNHMINGTKLLNVAGMTRGRRDGILKSEKVRHVVKIGPMHLKGVWIPFERALDFANKEKITEQLYPLFVHNIGGLLYHPTNQTRTNAVVAATERRRLEGNQGRTATGSQAPTLHHHHSMNNPIGSHMPQPPHSIAPHPGAGRPGLDRAHTFPTPPTSASSIMGMGNQGSSYEWGGQSIGSGVPGTQPLSIDTGLSNARSMPTTPATTPPGNSMHSMQPYQSQQNYDNSKPYYSAPPPSQTQYAPQQNIAQQNMARFGQPMQSSAYIKNEMGPPTSRGAGAASDAEHHDAKPDQYSHSQGNGQVGHGTGEGEAEHEHETDYINENSAAYNTNRGSYTYSANPAIGSITGEHPHLSPEMTGSPSHQNGSGRGTPRTTGGSQPQWAPGYHTPPRPAPSSNLYNVMSDARGSGPNGTGGDVYGTSTGPATYSSSINGTTPSNKRMREDDDQGQSGRPDSRGADSNFDLKRRKTVQEGSVGGPVGGAPPLHGMKSGIMQRRR